ncbi:MAG TPA: SPFH domain-containing protein [Tepidiformaceae bacterium]|nr:SPFH domain-containing protein [Tepidiformaceae bacterium]
MTSLIPLVVGGIFLVVILVAGLYARYYVKVPPDQVAVFTGRGGFRLVRGGASFRLPVIERVDYMSLAPFETPLPIHGAYSKEGVQVNVEAVALVRFDSNDEAIRTSAERFLNANPEQLQQSIQEILSGHLRSICAKMTVEELNSSREALVQRVTEEAGSDFAGLGITLDVLTIQHISDDQGYLESIGRKRVAEVKRDAEIGEAEAARDAMVRSAEARRLGETAQAEADAAIAEATRDRDLRIARAKALVDAERARALQAGPLADAESRKEVVKAEVQVEEERVRSNIAVEQQEVLRQEQALEASIIKPAEAERQAAVLRAEGERLATVQRAEGTSQARALEGEGEAKQRISIAEARRRELEAEGEGEARARTLKAEALEAELTAEGQGQKAILLGEAEGKRELAASLNAYNQAALQLSVYPELIARLPEIAAAIAAPLAQVDRIVMLDGGGGNGSGPLGKYGATVPIMFAQAIETLRAVGLDIPALLGAAEESGTPVPPEARAVLEQLEADVQPKAAATPPPQAPPVPPEL